MRVFSIRSDSNDNVAAYLFYYREAKQFFIELPDNADPWKTPMILSKFAERGETTIDHYWSGIWVKERIIPTDRQNLGQILRENGMNSYDEFALLTLANGRCAQDDYYITEISQDELPPMITKRFRMKVSNIKILQYPNICITFKDGISGVCNVGRLMDNNSSFKALIKTDEGAFNNAKIMTDGYGIQWDDNMTVTYDKLYKNRKYLSD